MQRKYFLLVFSIVLLTLGMSIVFISAQTDNVDVFGRTLPEDAAPYEMQVWRNLCNSARTEVSFASAVSVYSRICDQNGFDKFGDSLVTLDNNLNTIPAAAESWEVSEDG